MHAAGLVCPVSRSPLRPVSRAVAEQELGGGPLVPPTAVGYTPVGVTDDLFVREDGGGAYPVVDGVPVLMAPELLVRDGDQQPCDVRREPYAEAYQELEHYSRSAAAEAADIGASDHARAVDAVRALPEAHRRTFPEPRDLWLDVTYELHAQWRAFDHLAPLGGRRLLQLGGRGAQAVKMLLAGAEEAWLVTPMHGELVFARALAAHAGVADRLQCAVGLAEELPFADATFDGVYTQGCLHHWVVPAAVPEVARVLVPGGRFAAVEPWRGPLYGLGTAVLGKRDPAVHCVVLTPDRVEPLLEVFPDAEISHHGALTRYPLLALWKAGYKPDRDRIWRLGLADDRLTARVPRLRATGSSVALLATAPEA